MGNLGFGEWGQLYQENMMEGVASRGKVGAVRRTRGVDSGQAKATSLSFTFESLTHNLL